MVFCVIMYTMYTCMLVPRTEREKYAKHRNKAQKYPGKYTSVIIDGMDQEKTALPHIISNPKSLAGSYTLDTHVTGVRAHGRITVIAIDCGEFPHDCNLNIHILLKVFELLKVCVFWFGLIATPFL